MKLMVCVFTDNHARYMDDELEPVPAGSVPPLYDIPLSQVNRVLYKDWQKKQGFVEDTYFLVLSQALNNL